MEPAEALAAELVAAGGEAFALQLDVAEADSIGPAMERAQAALGPIDWVVSNAGIAISAPLLRSAEQGLFERHMQVNFHGARRVVEALLPGQIERGYGRVVQIASSAALVGYAYVAAYVASKHALLGYTRSAALELKNKGIALGAVCPHYVDSPMTEASIARIVETTELTPEAARAFFAKQNPGGELVSVAEVAQACLAMLSSNITGRVMELTGGATVEIESGWELSQVGH
ncbi:MAG: 3-hydroxybutyrate dehydrogenase [Planctomycetota bacterium]|jgi:3-hydroxybutyrate dehydrogenase